MAGTPGPRQRDAQASISRTRHAGPGRRRSFGHLQFGRPAGEDRSGTCLFADGIIPAELWLIDSTVSTTAVVIGTYVRAGARHHGTVLTGSTGVFAAGRPGTTIVGSEARLHAMRSQIELRLRPDSAAPGLARAAIASAASGLPAVMVADAELLTSEVVSNAVRHAELAPSQEIVVRIVADGYVRIEVADLGLPFEADLREPGTDSRGWGLFLLDAIATSWGVEREGSGKRVWFEVGGSVAAGLL